MQHRTQHTTHSQTGPWNSLIDNLLNGADEKKRARFETWCLRMAADPTSKAQGTALLWGNSKGTGKSMLFHTLRAIYPSTSSVVCPSDILSPFSSTYLTNSTRFVLCDLGGLDCVESREVSANLSEKESVAITGPYTTPARTDASVSFLATITGPLDGPVHETFSHEVVADELGSKFFEYYWFWLYQRDGIKAIKERAAMLDYSCIFCGAES